MFQRRAEFLEIVVYFIHICIYCNELHKNYWRLYPRCVAAKSVVCENFKEQFPVLCGQAIQDGCSLVLCAVSAQPCDCLTHMTIQSSESEGLISNCLCACPLPQLLVSLVTDDQLVVNPPYKV